MKTNLCLLLLSGCWLPTAMAAELAAVDGKTPRHRHPVAVRAIDDTTAVVANQRSGTLSVIDAQKLSVVAEFDLQGEPTDLAVAEHNVLVTDARGRLLGITLQEGAAKLQWELLLPTHPVSICLSPDGRWCSVCSLWARKVVFVQLPEAGDTDQSPQVIATVELPFAPREQLLLAADSRLIVADAFGGRLAVIDLNAHQLQAIRSLPAHNIRGLALARDGQRIYVSHETLNERSPPRRSEVVWGMVASDALRVVRRDKLLDSRADVMDGSRFVMVGNATRGAGDPDALVINEDGRTVIALAGTSEVAVIAPDGYSLERVRVGRRPVAIARVGKDRFLVANELSDSVSLIDLGAAPDKSPQAAALKKTDDTKYGYAPEGGDVRLNVRHLSLGASPEAGPAERGEALFFDARLSAGNWYSCHSCHTDGHSSDQLADTLGDGQEGAPKRILSLLGVGETAPWGWLGNKPRLTDQVHQSLRLTMLGRQLAEREVGDLVAFLKTLKPPPPIEPATTDADRAAVAAGRKLFESLECNACHQGRTLTSNDTYDVGLKDELGNKRFNPPSLRGVGHRYRLFHDNRAAGIEQVIGDYKHQLPRPLSGEEQQLLVRYLKSL